MAKKINIEENVVVNTETIAKCFSMSPRRVRQLTEEGVITKQGYGRYDLIDTVSTYVTFLKLSADALNEDDVTESLRYEQWLHEKAKREKAEIELAHIKNEMHRSDEVEEVMNNMVMAFRQRMLSLPTKVALMLVNRPEPKYIEEVLEQNINEALGEISKYDPALFIEVTEEILEVEGDGQKTDATTIS